MASRLWSDIPIGLQDRIAASDHSALDLLAAWLHEHLFRRVSEDQIQKVCLTLCKLMASSRGRNILRCTPDIPNFLAGIAVRHRIDESRAQERFRRLIADFRRTPPRTAVRDPAATAAGAEMERAVYSSLLTLKPVEREAFVRAAVNGEAYREIARDLFEGAAPRIEDRLRQIVHRTRVKLRRLLGRLRED